MMSKKRCLWNLHLVTFISWRSRFCSSPTSPEICLGRSIRASFASHTQSLCQGRQHPVSYWLKLPFTISPHAEVAYGYVTFNVIVQLWVRTFCTTLLCSTSFLPWFQIHALENWMSFLCEISLWSSDDELAIFMVSYGPLCSYTCAYAHAQGNN